MHETSISIQSEKFDVTELILDIEKLYVETFSTQELIAIIRFYRTPEGATLLSKTPTLLTRSIAVAQKKAVTIATEVTDTPQQELKAEYIQKAKEVLLGIGEAAVAYHEFYKRLPQSAPPVPATVPRGSKYMPLADEWKQGGWRDLDFTLNQPLHYSYNMSVTADVISIRARGDLNGNGRVSEIVLSGKLMTVDGETKLVFEEGPKENNAGE